MIALPSPFSEMLAARGVVVGIGNRMCGDDAAGPVVIDRIKNRWQAYCVDAGVALENYVEKIARLEPQAVLLVDAVYRGLEPGTVSVIEETELSGAGISTHAPSIRMPIDYLKIRTSASILLMGIEPVQVHMDAAMSDKVARAVSDVAEYLVAVCVQTTG
jgi:hydrogenase maturation protease HycI